MPSKKVLMIAGIVVAALVVIIGIGMWVTSPIRTFNAFMKSVEAQDETKALTFVSKDIPKNKQENIGFFLDDWTSSDSISWTETKNESWRTKAEGEKKITVPTPHVFAHSFQSYVTVAFDDFEDPVIIVLRRKTENASSYFAQLFRGWEVVQIKYQPFDDDMLSQIEEGLNDNTNTSSAVPADNSNVSETVLTNTNSGTDETTSSGNTNTAAQ